MNISELNRPFAMALVTAALVSSGALAKAPPDRPGKPNHADAASDSAKRLPPGLQKQVDRGRPLPPGWQDKLQVGQRLDDEIFVHGIIIGSEPELGQISVRIDDRVVRLLAATHEIIEVLMP